MLLLCQPAGAQWVVTELPTLGGTGSMEAWAVNGAGVVCGHGPDASGVQCVFRYDGSMTVLPNLDATNPHSAARDINSDGVIAGFSWNAAGRERAVFWIGSTITELPTPAGVDPDRSMRAEAVNDAGVIVGHYFDNDWYAKPYYYDGAMHDLAPALAAVGLTGRSYAKGINNDGLICGHAQVGVYQLWTYDIATETVTVLGTIDPILSCFAAAINDAGHIVGRGMSSPTSTHHALLHDGAFRIIDPTVAEAQWSSNINNLGRIIGTADSGSDKWSWYSNGPGEGSIVPINLPGWTEIRVEGIDGQNRIAGYGKTVASGEDTRAFVIAPAGDSDADGDVDLPDFSGFQACFAPTGPLDTGCDVFDCDADGTVDLDDFSEFQAAMGGPGG
jgi:uncharacterized membrane protein